MITLANVPLLAPTPEVRDWVRANIDQRHAPAWGHRAWPGRRLARISFPTAFHPAPPIELNRLRWPWGAGRWCSAHLLCASTQLPAILAAALDSGSSSSYGEANAPLTLRFQVEELGADGLVETDLYLLPPTPLARVDRGPGETLVDVNGLWLLSLVDERFWWGSLPLPEYGITDETSWEDLIGVCEDATGVALPFPDIPSAYGRPHKTLSLRHEAVGPVLDAVLFNCGLRLVRNLDSTYEILSADASRARFAANLAASASLPRARAAGGERFGAVAEDFDVDARPLVVPEVVAVAFPKRFCDGTVADPDEDWWLEPSGASEYDTAGEYSGDEIAPPLPPPGSKVLRDTAVATFTDRDDPVPNNLAELQALQQQVQADYRDWMSPSADLVYWGVAAWDPEAHSDAILIDDMADRIATRVLPAPWDGQPEEFNHALGEDCPPLDPCCARLVRIDGERDPYTGLYPGFLQEWDAEAMEFVDGAEVDVVDANEP